MDQKYIIDGNILLYSLNNSKLIEKVRQTLHINTKHLIYDEQLKYFHNTSNSKYYEYVFTKSIKNELVDILIKKNKQIKDSIISHKKYIIFHNFHYVSEKYFKQFKNMIENISKSVVFIFTSNKQISFLTSFVLTKFVKFEKTDYEISFKTNIENDCNKIIEYIYISYEKIDFLHLRNKLYDLLFSYQDSTIILNTLCELAVKKKPNQYEDIIHISSTVDAMKRKGNKDIIYLEHFILLLINNDNI